MRGVRGFTGIRPSSGSMSTVEVLEKDYVGLAEVTSSYPTAKDGIGRVLAEEDEQVREEQEGEEEEELELGLSLGAKKVTGGGTTSKAAPWGEYCRILTAKDFPSLVSRASPLSSSSSVSSSSATLGGAVTGTKRTADSVSPDVVGSANPPSQVVVGWPPIRAYRMNSLVNQSKDNTLDGETTTHKKSYHNSSNNIKEGINNKDQEKKGGLVGTSLFVKVKMDGDPIGRKVDLNAHLSYETLALALEAMFHKPTTAFDSSIHGTKASKLLDGSSEFALTYEDKDGDWMLVGDVPWGMFLNTVKRLRIMRTSDANGLAPRCQSSSKAGGLRSKPT